MRRRIELLELRTDETVARLMKSLRRFSVFALLLDTLDAFSKDNMGVLAAALSYYALLALFPLLLVLIAVASALLSGDDALRTVLVQSRQYLPGAETELKKILTEVVDLRGSVTLFGFLALLWTASGVFDVLQNAFDRAWRVPRPRAFWLQRLYSIAVIGIMGMVFVASVLSSTLPGNMMANIFGESVMARAIVRALGRTLGVAVGLFAYAVLYKTFPHARVSWRPALWGGLVAALLWELAKYVYEFYLVNIASLNLVYGSLGAIIGLLLWGYISATILLFGAELAAAIARR